jgi:formamidopyrimidine-DNA glycosylase
MPEGHTIHRLARDQQADLGGRPVHASAAQDRFAEGAARLDGAVLVEAEAWGKHLFHAYDSGDVLHVHLGLIGKFARHEGPAWGEPRPTVRLRLGGDGAAWDLTGPMVCRLVTPDERDHVVATLGPDPLRPDADRERFHDKVLRSTKPIGLLLMEQDVIAGIGNVYRSELLNIVGIDPRRPGRKVTRDELDALWTETVRQLKLGVRRNQIVTMRTDELDRPVSKLARGEGRYAYQQERCGRCHTVLDVFPIAGRTTWRCPTCQPS